MDVYGAALRNVLFPAWERLRGRPTFGLLEYLQKTETASAEELDDLRTGFLRRLLRHAYRHTSYYRARFDAIGMVPEDVKTVADLATLPLLERVDAQTSLEERTSPSGPSVVVTKGSSGTTGQPMIVRYNAESRHWRDAVRWRGYGWAGYRPGDKAVHYWGTTATPPGRLGRWKVEVDHRLRRDHYVDCGLRSEEQMRAVADLIRRERPRVILAYSQAGGDLARFINDQGLRDWEDTPVLCGAEAVWPRDREAMMAAFGGVFETYGCREFMMMGTECEVHDGLHEAMENLVVEIIVREPDGTTRPARPGEEGDVVVTDLHNLACPLIRYVTGDLAVERATVPCACGRTLRRFGPVQGRVTDTLRDRNGNAVNGLMFNILFTSLHVHARQFQAIQRADGRITLRVVPHEGGAWPPAADRVAHDWVAKYLPGLPFGVEVVDEIPLTAAGKRRYVIVEKPG